MMQAIALLATASFFSGGLAVDLKEHGICVGDCVGKWQQCGGTNHNGNNVIDGFKDCCDEGFQCYSINQYYSQCRTAASSKNWDGPFQCAPCGPDSAEYGSWHTPGCGWNHLGDIDGMDSCDELCASLGYIACEYYAGDQGEFCYGYTELVPGGCNERDNTVYVDYFQSWYVCPREDAEDDA